MASAQDVLDRYADGTPYAELARAFLELDRWTGDDPVLLLAETAAATTGQRFETGVKPAVGRFRDAFVENGRVSSFADLAAIEPDDEALVEAFGAQRKRRVLVEGAARLDDRKEADDLDALTGWAAGADPYRYREDPIGSISGVGPSSFQYLRMLAGVDAARPDPDVTRLVEAVDAELADSPLDASEPLRAIASCEWLAVESSYRPIEIDRIAWWTYADETERAGVRDESA
ncbi:hypothetical protein [Halovivax sp.]|uniref:hypothetical protein n=1 Tax=Halovivax sp. TaxID=1935978 RepID=UPI0025C53924|nr:hypothetical protein [Halovivax sp.]